MQTISITLQNTSGKAVLNILTKLKYVTLLWYRLEFFFGYFRCCCKTRGFNFRICRCTHKIKALHYIISKSDFELTDKLDMYLSFQGLFFPFPLKPQLERYHKLDWYLFLKAYMKIFVKHAFKIADFKRKKNFCILTPFLVGSGFGSGAFSLAASDSMRQYHVMNDHHAVKMKSIWSSHSHLYLSLQELL